VFFVSFVSLTDAFPIHTLATVPRLISDVSDCFLGLFKGLGCSDRVRINFNSSSSPLSSLASLTSSKVSMFSGTDGLGVRNKNTDADCPRLKLPRDMTGRGGVGMGRDDVRNRGRLG